VTVSNLPSTQGKTQSAVVHLRTVTTEPTIVERAKDLQKALSTETLSLFAQQRSAAAGDEADTGAGWKALLSLFQSNSRDELVTLLGFSKAEVAARVAEAVASLKATARAKSPIEQDVADSKPFEPSVVSFAEPLADEATPSEVSATTDATGPTEQGDGESTTTAPSLFGDEQPATPQTDATADFFSSMGLARNAGADQMEVPHTDYPADSSVAATIASRPSSAMSELKATTFRIYPRDESETDRLVTKALVLGDFESAVSLCLSTDRFADALLLAVKGGPELLQRTQKEYFERRTASHPYLRLFQSVVTDDLADIVQNADLQEWQEIFVVLCTFASQEEFAGLTEQLGQRLEFASSLARASDGPDTETLRKNATLTYLAAGKLERLVNIWIEELAEEEKRVLEDPESADESRYNAHAHALQTLIEKVIVFRSAIKYDDADLALAAAPGATRTYKLGALYERYFEYADLLATQGLVKEAVAFIKLTPGDYAGSPGTQIDFATGRDRLLAAAGVSAAVAAAAPVAPARVPPQPVYGGYNVPPPAQPAYPQQSNGSGLGYSTGHALPPTPYTLGGGAPPAPPSGLYTPASVPTQAPPPGPYTPSAPIASAAPPAPGPYGYSAGQYGVMGSGPNHIPGSGPYRPPQPAFQPAQPAQPPVPPPKRGPVPGWNDAPVIPERRAGAGSASKPGTPAPIMSPFLNAGPPSLAGPGSPQVASGGLPPPPRSGSAAGFQGPPPRGGMGLPPPSRPPTNPPPPGGRLPPGPPPPAGTPGGAPPMRGHMAPPQGGFAPPAQAGPYAQQQPMGQPGMQAPPPPSGPYAPPPGAQGAPPPSNPYGAPANAQPGPYGPPPGAQPGPYGPPAGAQGGMPPPPGGGPPPPGAGGPPPPPGGPASGPPRSSSLRTKPGPPPPKYREPRSSRLGCH
jgi:protein transport protein SEC31